MSASILAIDPSFRNIGVVKATPDDSQYGYTIQSASWFGTAPDTKKRADVLKANRDIEDILKLAGFLKGQLTEDVRAVVVELPTSGAQSSSAARALGIATGLMAVFIHYPDLMHLWVTPSDVKMAAVGKKTASKVEIMDSVVNRWPDFGTQRAKLGDGKFEHVADAASALLAVRNTNEYLMLKAM